MLQTQKVLLIAPSAMTGSPAFERAGALALAMQLPLHIVAFDSAQALAAAGVFSPEQISAARDSYLHSHRQWLEAKIALQGHQCVEVTSEVVWLDNPDQEILHFVNKMPLALIVKDIHKDPSLNRVFFTPLDWQLLCETPVPVHLVTRGLNPTPRFVLAIVNLPHRGEEDRALTEQVIDIAVTLSGGCGARFELVHTYDWTAIYGQDLGSGVLPLATGIYQAWGVTQYAVSAALAERRGVPLGSQHLIEGPPPCVVDFATEQRADIIVMGLAQEKGRNNQPGASAEQLLHRAPCSVLAIKSTSQEVRARAR